jgi:hypothetical protein
MIVVPKVSEQNQRIESLTLTAIDAEDDELLEALYRNYTRAGMIEITLRDGQRLRSVITEKRRSPRVSMRLPVVLLWEEGEQQHEEHTFTTNLSWYGCAVYSHRFFQPKTPVRVLYGKKMIEAQTVFSLEDHSTNLVEVGIDFGRDSSDFWGIAALHP